MAFNWPWVMEERSTPFGKSGKIVISKVSSGIKTDRRAKLRAAAVKVRKSMSPESRQMKADDIMAFLRGDDLATSG